MSGFSDFARNARDLEHALEVTGVMLGIDWNNDTVVRALATEALASRPEQVEALVRSTDPALRAKGKLFALSNLMLHLMAESASTGVHTHGGCAWKAFGRALFEVSGAPERPKAA
jgi:hypothetical protein